MSRKEQYRQGIAALQEDRFEEAIAHLEPLAGGTGAVAVVARFYLGQAHHRLAVRLFEGGRYQEAIGHFQAAARLNPAGGGFAWYLAACYLGAGRFDLAVGELERLLRQQPEDADLRVRLALALWRQNGEGDAIAVLRDGKRLRPDSPEISYQLGVMLAARDELTEARRCFEAAIEMDPGHAPAHEKLAQCLAVAGDHEQALRRLEQAHRLDPSNARIALQLGLLARSAAASGRSVQILRPVPGTRLDDSAVRRLGELVVQEPEFVETFLALPASGVDAEVFSALAAILQDALARHPEYADLHYHCGQVHRRLGHERKAIEHARQAVSLNPRYVNALILLAGLYRQTSQWAAGIDRLQQALEAGADYPDVHYLLGQLHQGRGDRERACEAYRRALALNGDFRAAKEALDALKTVTV